MTSYPSQRQAMSLDEWRARESVSEERHEYIDGKAYLKPGGTLIHAAIIGNILCSLKVALKGKLCIPYGPDLAARLSPTRYVYPDATITCDPRDWPTDDVMETQSPRVVFEVLSDLTEEYDKTDKFMYYSSCPTVEEYVLVSTKCQEITVRRRTPELWLGRDVSRSGETILLKSIDIGIPVEEFYDEVPVPETLPGHRY